MPLLAAWVFAASATPVLSEPFLDLYGGWSKAGNTDVSASQRLCATAGCTQSVQTMQRPSFQSGASLGLRGGYWFDRVHWFGLAGDLSYYRTASAPVRLDSASLAATPMVRLPLWTTPDRPHGLLQPYVAAGPTLVFHSVSTDFQPASSVSLAGWSMGVGWTTRAGMAVAITRRIALFSEWRFSQDRVAFRRNGFFGLGEQGRLDMTQTTRHYLFGLSYRF